MTGERTRDGAAVDEGTIARVRWAWSVVPARACFVALSLLTPACADVIGIQTFTNAALPDASADLPDPSADLPDASTPLDAGDDATAPAPAPLRQAVVWFGLNSGVGGSCSSVRTYQFPSDARSTTTSQDGAGARVIDGIGDYGIACNLAAVPERPGLYTVNLQFHGAEVGTFSVTGQLTWLGPGAPGNAEGPVAVTFDTVQFSLTQNDCTLMVASLDADAIWVQNLSCPNLRDPRSPSTSCDGRGSVIFENCTH